MNDSADADNRMGASSAPPIDGDAASRGTATSHGSSSEQTSAKQTVIEALFRHTNAFLAEHRKDPLLVVEALAAILVRYAALLGPVEQMPERLRVLELLISQECAQIQIVAKAAQWENKGTDS